MSLIDSVSWRSVELLFGLLAAVVGFGPGPSQPTNCFAQPSRCGYPDATNTGVPPGTKLKPSGSIKVVRNGTTLDRRRIVGTVTVEADDVTIKDSKLSTKDDGSTAVVMLEKGADDFTLEDSEVEGNGSRTDAPESGVWNHYNNPGAKVIRSYIHGTPDNWEGRVDLVKDSYMVVDASQPGSHDENIYVWCTKVNVNHSTLVNQHRQTATVFGDALDCEGNRFTVTHSLLAGGGFTLYAQSGGETHPVPDASTTITDNRFARCRTKQAFDEASGGTACRGGPDSYGLYPRGGYFGVITGYVRSSGEGLRRNVWDDNLRPICPHGSC